MTLQKSLDIYNKIANRVLKKLNSSSLKTSTGFPPRARTRGAAALPGLKFHNLRGLCVPDAGGTQLHLTEGWPDVLPARGRGRRESCGKVGFTSEGCPVSHRRGCELCASPTRGSSPKSTKAFARCCRPRRWPFRIGKGSWRRPTSKSRKTSFCLAPRPLRTGSVCATPRERVAVCRDGRARGRPGDRPPHLAPLRDVCPHWDGEASGWCHWEVVTGPCRITRIRTLGFTPRRRAQVASSRRLRDGQGRGSFLRYSIESVSSQSSS